MKNPDLFRIKAEGDSLALGTSCGMNRTRDIAIRPALPSDTPSLLLLDTAIPRLPERGRFIENAVSANTCFVAILDGTIVGYAVLEYTFYGYGFISMVMVSLDHRRKGVGQALARSC